MNRSNPKIYCAGPLFNPKEREEMASIAAVLKNAGYEVFLPQEDGLEFCRLLPVFVQRKISLEDATQLLNMAIFSLDVFEVMNADGLLLNMNGRVPDEGAMVEAGIAWSHNKEIVIFKSDDRSLVHGNCNPLVMGLAEFVFVQEYGDIAEAFERRFSARGDGWRRPTPSGFETAHHRGAKIKDFLLREKSMDELAQLLIDLFGETSCLNTREQIGSCSRESVRR